MAWYSLCVPRHASGVATPCRRRGFDGALNVPGARSMRSIDAPPRPREACSSLGLPWLTQAHVASCPSRGPRPIHVLQLAPRDPEIASFASMPRRTHAHAGSRGVVDSLVRHVRHFYQPRGAAAMTKRMAWGTRPSRWDRLSEVVRRVPRRLQCRWIRSHAGSPRRTHGKGQRSLGGHVS